MARTDEATKKDSMPMSRKRCRADTESVACIEEITLLGNGKAMAASLRQWVAAYQMEKIIAATEIESAPEMPETTPEPVI